MTLHDFSTQYNTTQNSSDDLSSYLQTTIIAQMLFIGGEGAPCVQNDLLYVKSDVKFCPILLVLFLYYDSSPVVNLCFEPM